MIFKNKKAYVINRYSDNDLNPESYDLVTNNDFVFESTFKLTTNKSKTSESCIISRQGYNMGIYIHHFNDENFIKWVWWEVDEKNNHVCNEIFVHKKYKLTDITNVKVIKKDNEFSLFVNGELYETKEITNSLFDYDDKLMYVAVSDPNNTNNNCPLHTSYYKQYRIVLLLDYLILLIEPYQYLLNKLNLQMYYYP
jgi:hypothetical protein